MTYFKNIYLHLSGGQYVTLVVSQMGHFIDGYSSVSIIEPICQYQMHLDL